MCRQKFKFQYKLGPYIYDFCSTKYRLLIELDGSWHDNGTQPRKDLEKSEYAKLRRYRILRFKNDEVWKDIKGVGKQIRKKLKQKNSQNNF